MQEKQYHEKAQKCVQSRLAKLEGKEQKDSGTFSAFPNQAYRFEEMLNEARYKLDSNGFVLVPIRQPHQVQYKLGRAYPQLGSFKEEELDAETTSYARQSLSKRRVKKELFYCILVLTELQKDPATFLLTQVPDPIYFKLGDYREIIHRPLDLITICGKLMRNEYSGADGFQNDMVTMIQNNKIYFMFHAEIYSLLLRFEEQFWFLIEEKVPRYQEAVASRMRTTRFQGVEKRRTSKRKKYDKYQRKELVALVAEQSNQRKKIILDYVKQNCSQYLKKVNYNDTIEVQAMPVRFLREIEGLCEIRIQFDREEEQAQPSYTGKEFARALGGEGDIYFGSDEDDD